MREKRPDALVAVDFPDFNFRLAHAARALGIPVVYYISPQLWAWRPGRMKTMRRITDRVLVIFPFEEKIYRDAGVPVEWVGHPLLDVADPAEPRERFLERVGLDAARPVVALLPGSRRNELRAILPGLAAAARIIATSIPGTQFVLARAPHLPDDLLAPIIAMTDPRVVIVDGGADNVLAAANVALVASGTVTVQAALHGCPMVVVYRLSPLTYRLGRPFVQVDTFAMVNLVAGRRVVPELMQDDFTPERVAAEALTLLRDPDAAARTRTELLSVRTKLGEPGASARAARAVIDVAAGAARSLG
jgi:lipid-A-disaccharide synthase